MQIYGFINRHYPNKSSKNMQIKEKIKNLLLWSQKYTKADMVYLAKGGLWSSLSFLISSLLSLLLVVAFANLIPKETYGIYKYIMSLGGALGFLALTGMNTAITQAVAKGYEGALKEAVKIQLKWGALFSIAAGIGGIYYFLKGNQTFALSLIILGIFFPVYSAFNSYGFFLTGKKEFKLLAKYQVIFAFIYTAGMIAGLYFTKNIVILVLIYSISHFLTTIYFYSRTLKTFKPKEGTTMEQKELFKFGGHLSIVNIFSTISQYVDKIAVFQFLGPTQLAIYALALAMPDRIKGFIKSITGIILPKLSEKNVDEIKPMFYKRTLQGLAAGAILSGIYILIAPFIFKVFFPKYLDSVFYSQLIALSFIVIVPGTYMGSVFRSQKMIKTIYFSSTATNISRIVLFLVFGMLWGILGIIFASLLMYLIGLIYNFVLWEIEVKKYSELNGGDIDQDPLTE